MDSQETANNAAESTSSRGGNVVKSNVPLSPGFQPRPQGPPGTPRHPINNGPVGGPRPGGQGPPQIRRLDSRSSLGPPGAGQFVQLRPYGPPRPPGNSFPPRTPQHPQGPAIVLNPRFVQLPGPRAGPQQGAPRPPYPGHYQQFQRTVQRFQQLSSEGVQEGFSQQPRNPENSPRPQEIVQRQLQRNESSLSLPRQSAPSSEEGNKQLIRPRIVIERMADVENASKIRQMESPVQRKKAEMRENTDNDDDDDVVMDTKKSPRSNGQASDQEGLMESKSPRRNEDVQSTSRPGTATINGKVEEKAGDGTMLDRMEKVGDSSKSPEPARIDSKTEECEKRPVSGRLDDRPVSGKVDEKTENEACSKIEDKSKDSMETVDESSKEKSKEERCTSGKTESDRMSDKSRVSSASSNIIYQEKPSPPVSATVENKHDKPELPPRPSATPDQSQNDQSSKTPTKPDRPQSSTPETKQDQVAESKTPSKSPDKSRAVTPADVDQTDDSKSQLKSAEKSRSSNPAVDQLTTEDIKAPSKSPDKSRSSTPGIDQSSTDELKIPSKSPEKSPSSTPAIDPSSTDELKAPSSGKSRASTPAMDPSSTDELKAPSSGKSRASTPAMDPSSTDELKAPSSDKSRASTPGMDQVSADELKAPSSDKSRASTPGMDQVSADELKAPTCDKSRASTPGMDQVSAEELKAPAKSPDKSRASTPAMDQPLIEELKVPPKSPDTRSTTPGEGESVQADTIEIFEIEKPSESPGPDKSAENDTLLNEADTLLNETANLASPGSENSSSKSPKSPATPDSQVKLSVPGSILSPPKSPDDGVRGFDNGQRRSLSSKSSPCYSPQSPTTPKSPKSPVGSGKIDGEKKKTTFAPDSVDRNGKENKKSADSRKPSRSPTPRLQRAPTPAKIDETMEKKSPEAEIENGSATNESAESNAVPTTNGVSDSPTKKSPSKSKDSDKKSTAGSPLKSPSKSGKSLPRTPETPTSTGGLEKKKVPMNKVQVGSAPSPNLKTVRSKIGSLDNASYKPGGGKVKIENRKLDFSKAQPKIAAKNEKYTPSGGDKKISQVKLQWNAKPKVGSLDNATYKPGGGDKKIETVKLDFKDKAKPKVGSKDNAKHVPGGGAVKSSATPPKTPQETPNDIQTQKVDVKAESKIGSLDNVKHKPGGGDKKIFNDKDYLRQTGSNVESLSGSGSQVQSPEESGSPVANEPTKDESPQPPPTTPTKARNLTSPSSMVTPKAVRSSLAKSPDATGPKRSLTPVESTAEGGNKKSPTTEESKKEKSRSPTSPRPPSSLRLKSPDKSAPATPRKTSPKELRLPKLAPSPVAQETTPIPETHSKISLPKLIEPSAQSTRVAY